MRKSVAILGGFIVMAIIIVSIADNLMTPALTCPRCGQPLALQTHHRFLHADADDYRCSSCNTPFRWIHWQDGTTELGQLAD